MNDHNRVSGSRESGIVQRLRNSVSALPIEHPHVLLACSGGKDSVALASMLADLQRLELLTFSIAHVHHGQHDRADDAAAAVESIGQRLGVPVVVRRLNRESIQKHKGVGLEEALRRERYLALTDIATEHNADCIAVAHHETDQAETILLHLIRGAGLDGLSGMREWEHRAVPWWPSDVAPQSIAIWRPLLSEHESKLANIAEASGLTVVEDPTNVDTAFRRNAIRHELLPVLERISAGSTSAIARTTDVIGEDVRYLDTQADEFLESAIDDSNLPRQALTELHPAMQRRVLRRWIAPQYPEIDLTLERIDAIRDLAYRNRGGSRVEIGSGLSVTLRSGRLVIIPWQNRDQ